MGVGNESVQNEIQSSVLGPVVSEMMLSPADSVTVNAASALDSSYTTYMELTLRTSCSLCIDSGLSPTSVFPRVRGRGARLSEHPRQFTWQQDHRLKTFSLSYCIVLSFLLD